MLRRLPLKAWIGIGAGAVAVVAAVVTIIVISNRPEAYRTIKVYDIIGSAQVMRGEDNVMDAYNSMRLESDDDVTTGEDSYLQLKLDEDKYVLLEPETEISIVATGTQKDSKTQIFLNKGAISNCIREELSDSSEYKINTPNSTIAVRGTTFRVELRIDENGETYTVVTVYEGTVVSNLIYPDGTVDDKEVEITAGQEVHILGTDETSMYLGVGEEAGYEELDLEVLEFLKLSIEAGKNLSISKEELQELIDSFKGTEDSTDKDDEKPTEESNEDETETDEEDATDEDLDEETEESGEGKTEGATDGTEETTTSDSTDKTTEATTEEPTTEEPTTVAPGFHLVSFKYNGKVFATQQIKDGEVAVRPTMKPASTGNWDYDFKKAVTSDITINWVQ